jgi:hypothetical protein
MIKRRGMERPENLQDLPSDAVEDVLVKMFAPGAPVDHDVAMWLVTTTEPDSETWREAVLGAQGVSVEVRRAAGFVEGPKRAGVSRMRQRVRRTSTPVSTPTPTGPTVHSLGAGAVGWAPRIAEGPSLPQRRSVRGPQGPSFL